MTEIKAKKLFFNLEIPSGWEVKHFEEIADIDKESLKGNTQKDYEFDYVSLSDVDSEDFKIETTRVLFGNAPSRARRIVKQGDILMSTVRPNLQAFSLIRNEVKDLIASTGFAVITAKNCSNEFLFQYLFSSGIERQFYQLLVGSNYPAINSSDVRKLKIPLPPLPEQRAIAQVLGKMDEAIQTTERLISQKELRKKWLMQNLLTGKMRLKGFEREWREYKLSDLFDRVTRKNIEGNTTVVTISAQRGFVRQTDFFNKNIASEITDNYFLVEKGEFCYNKSYSNGYPWGATKRLKDFDKAVVTTLYICFGIKESGEADPEFFEQFFEANQLDKGLTKIAHEGGRAHGLLNVTPSDFFSLKIKIPDFEEQTAIARVLQTADQEISLLKAKADKLREQKKGMMQVLLTGRVRVKLNEP
ncbi:Type I restriction-modification system, specificity subunit S [Mariniradius saccharolyticus AK6]|uniref:Type I restriction-modification system, specificity subunit S n=1 Tax=Mariniradius saccharolyticus AK6 TaxID=1239962 RepID=M7X6U7_9BACT|nr:restriction endonuclease subunit S [Mariniradius saccharolyticus]EMS33170.1 Type I restriction-modification system, specificity subunit S [Mariniradius saccharolyticus AK6]